MLTKLHIDVLTCVNAAVASAGGVLAIVRVRRRALYLTLASALVGAGMIALGAINFVRVPGPLSGLVRLNVLWGIGMCSMLAASVLLGGLLGATVKLESRKLAPALAVLGVVAIVGSSLVLLFQLRVLKYF